MKLHVPAPLLLCLFPWACASTNEEARPLPAAEPRPAEPDAAVVESFSAAPVEAAWSSPARERPARAEAPPQSGMSPLALSIWNEPWFQRWFVESYAAETEIEPGVSESERGQLERILELMAKGELDKARVLLEKQRSDTSSAAFEFMLANIYFQREEFEQAAAALEVAIEKHPKFRRAWQNLGVIRFREGDYERALPCLTQVIELGGANAITYGMLGFAYSSVEEFLPAESAYRMAILLDPRTMDWKQGLVFCLFKQARFAESAALCDAMIAQDPDRAELWMMQANAYLGLEKPLQAAENLELVDRLGESTASSLEKLGDIYASEELHDLALGAYLRALDEEPDAAAPRGIRAARILAARGALNETGQLLEHLEGLPTEPLDAEQQKSLLRLRAQVAVSQGADDEQARVLEEIVELDPMDGQALILLARHYELKGEAEQATFYYERAMNLEKFEADACVGLAQLLVRRSEYKEALPLLRRALNLEDREKVREFLQQVERYAGAR